MKQKHEHVQGYEDIINLSHPISASHPQMSMLERAAQFSPFAALSGHSAAIRETARLTDEFSDPDENSRENLDRKLAYIQEHLREQPEITVVFFQPDNRKEGGSYQSVSGNIKKIDAYERRLIMSDGTALPMEYVIQIDIHAAEENQESR